jgi:hypothetical protein
MSEKARVVGAAGGAVGLGAFAAALGWCCAAPWAVALLGVGGAVAFARLTFLLPYAIVGAALSLGVAFWWVYRPVAVCTDATCAPKTRRRLRSIVWIAAVLVGALSIAALWYRVAL